MGFTRIPARQGDYLLIDEIPGGRAEPEVALAVSVIINSCVYHSNKMYYVVIINKSAITDTVTLVATPQLPKSLDV